MNGEACLRLAWRDPGNQALPRELKRAMADKIPENTLFILSLGTASTSKITLPASTEKSIPSMVAIHRVMGGRKQKAAIVGQPPEIRAKDRYGENAAAVNIAAGPRT